MTKTLYTNAMQITYKSLRELVQQNISVNDDLILNKGDEIFEMVRSGAELFYPRFAKWFNNKHLWSVYMQKSERDIIYAEDELNRLLGAACTLNNDLIKRISMLYVKEEARGNGIARGLIKECMKTLETEFPSFSLRESNVDQFQKLLREFKWAEVAKGPLTKQGHREVYYNHEFVREK